MAKKKASSSQTADDLYREARTKWAAAVDLGLYDEEESILRVTGLLQKAVRQDPSHTRALALLCDLLAALTAYEEASDLVARLRNLQPDVEEHRTRQELLALPDAKEKRAKVMERLAVKWQCTSDW
jgi:hypothetical protein